MDYCLPARAFELKASFFVLNRSSMFSIKDTKNELKLFADTSKCFHTGQSLSRLTAKASSVQCKWL